MKLSDLTHGLKDLVITGNSNPEVTGLAIDSRKVQSGFLFAAIKGSVTDGHNHIQDALNSGAVAVICSNLPEQTDDTKTYLLVGDVSASLGEICSNFYDHPDQDLHIVGITGTNGKTSIATWLYQLGGQLGYTCGLISTIRIMIKEKPYPTSHTTPDIISLYHHLQLMVKAGCQYVFMEVSSHALDQKRVAGLKFKGAVFTNLTQDHLDYHLDFPAYIRAKKLLFDGLGRKSFALVNSDDRNGDIMLQNSDAKALRYSTRTLSNYQGKLIEQISQGMLLEINGNELWVPFIGRFNASNLTAVYAVAIELAWIKDEVLREMSAMKQVVGRFERFDLGNQITGIVDYAHTPDAIENVLEAIRDICQQGRIITVIGAGGNRDKGKRPKMALAACRNSDIVILTSDNPRSEDPENIIEDMKAGIPAEMESQVFSLTNRKEAIKLAFALAQSGDFVLVAGKGHENYQEIKGKRLHFDDREELMKITEGS